LGYGAAVRTKFEPEPETCHFGSFLSGSTIKNQDSDSWALSHWKASVKTRIPMKFFKLPKESIMKFVVIGGDATGMSAASRAKRNRPDLDVTVLEKTMDVSYSA
jgi:hypothetical protein